MMAPAEVIARATETVATELIEWAADRLARFDVTDQERAVIFTGAAIGAGMSMLVAADVPPVVAAQRVALVAAGVAEDLV